MPEEVNNGHVRANASAQAKQKKILGEWMWDLYQAGNVDQAKSK